jgi:flagellar hook-associated protein 3 FlgL
MKTDIDTDLPLSSDGAAAWLKASTGNGVFMTSSALNSVTGNPITGASIDAGSVSNPSALFPVADTGYRIHFTSSSTYDIESYSLSTGLTSYETTGTYQPGVAIDLYGMSVTVSGAPTTGDQFNIEPSTPTLSVFDSIDQAIADLQTPNRTPAQRVQSTADSLRDIDSSMATLNLVRTAAGGTLNRIDNETSRLATQKLNAQTTRSNAEDLDMVEAIADFQNQQTGYEAALKSYSMVQKMSLFQYLGG